MSLVDVDPIVCVYHTNKGDNYHWTVWEQLSKVIFRENFQRLEASLASRILLLQCDFHHLVKDN